MIDVLIKNMMTEMSKPEVLASVLKSDITKNIIGSVESSLSSKFGVNHPVTAVARTVRITAGVGEPTTSNIDSSIKTPSTTTTTDGSRGLNDI